MKKLLSAITAITLVSSTVPGVVACHIHHYDMSQIFYVDEASIFTTGHFADFVIPNWWNALAKEASDKWNIGFDEAKSAMTFKIFTQIASPLAPPDWHDYDWTITPDTPKQDRHKQLAVGFLITLIFAPAPGNDLFTGENVEQIQF